MAPSEPISELFKDVRTLRTSGLLLKKSDVIKYTQTDIMNEKPLDREEEMEKDKPAILGGLDKKSMDNEAAATKKRYVEKRMPRTSELK